MNCILTFNAQVQPIVLVTSIVDELIDEEAMLQVDFCSVDTHNNFTRARERLQLHVQLRCVMVR